jgi:poly(hydroxyalkanoate) depolymerase family esterase
MMSKLPATDMAGALRLTRQGRLKEALAVLQGKPAVQPMTAPEKYSRSGHSGILQFVDAALNGALGKKSQPEPEQFLRRSLGPGADNVSRPPSKQSRFEERSFANQAGSRKYKLFVPSGYHGQHLPLVVMLHGCSQSPDDFAAGTRMNDLAESQGFLVAYPEQTRSANVSKCWNWFVAGNQGRDQGEASLIAGITRQIMRDFAVLPTRVYVAGLSAGGAAAAIMGAAYPELYAAIGIHSGLACGAASDLPSALNAMRHGAAAPMAVRPAGSARLIPAIVFHGDRDTTVNIANASQIIAQSKGAGDLQVTVTQSEAGGMHYTCTVQSDGGRPLIEEWVLHGAGHAWSGGSAAGSFTNPQGPNASQEMIRFFFQQSLPA